MVIATEKLVRAKDSIGVTSLTEVQENHQSHYWHEGIMCQIQCAGVVFSIEAHGEIRFELSDKLTKRHLVYVKDKVGAGSLEHELKPYIWTDNELFQVIKGIHPRYEGQFIDSNWYECFIFYKGECVDSYVLDAELLVDAIDEVQFGMHDIAAEIIMEGLPF